MTDSIIISFQTGAPLGSDSDEDNPLLEDIKLPEDNAWEAAAKDALTDGAIWGVLIWVNEDGDMVRVPILADRVSLRGLLEESLDDLKAG